MDQYDRFSASGINALPRFGREGDDSSVLDRVHIKSPTFALYVHVPFCRALCHFCMLRRGSTASQAVPDEFVTSLLLEVELVARIARGARVDAIYFGGGTPSLLRGHQVSQILTGIRGAFSVEPDAEVTFEGEASSLSDRTLLDALEAEGVSRVSFGIQTFDGPLRELLGRTDTLDELWHLRDLLDEYEFREINVDLMYALPGTDVEFVLREMERLRAFSPTGVDCHPLKYSSCAPEMLREVVRQGRDVPEAALRIAMFTSIREALRSFGHTEMFADQYSRSTSNHSCKYLRHLYGLDGGEYLGLGPGARSHYGDVACQNLQGLGGYRDALASGYRPIRKAVAASLSDNYITCFPKRNDALLDVDIRAATSADFFAMRLAMLLDGGYLERAGTGFRLTALGLSWYQNVQEDLLSEQQVRRHQETATLRERAVRQMDSHFHGLRLSGNSTIATRSDLSTHRDESPN